MFEIFIGVVGFYLLVFVMSLFIEPFICSIIPKDY